MYLGGSMDCKSCAAAVVLYLFFCLLFVYRADSIVSFCSPQSPNMTRWMARVAATCLAVPPHQSRLLPAWELLRPLPDPVHVPAVTMPVVVIVEYTIS